MIRGLLFGTGKVSYKKKDTCIYKSSTKKTLNLPTILSYYGDLAGNWVGPEPWRVFLHVQKVNINR